MLAEIRVVLYRSFLISPPYCALVYTAVHLWNGIKPEDGSLVCKFSLQLVQSNMPLIPKVCMVRMLGPQHGFIPVGPYCVDVDWNNSQSVSDCVVGTSQFLMMMTQVC